MKGQQKKDQTRVSRNEIVRAARNIRRRYALYYLNENGRRTPLSDIAEQVAAWESDTTPDDVSPSHRKSVYNSLLQTHLPKLEDLEIIDFHTDSSIVELTDTGDRIDIYLANDPRTMIKWYQVYLAVGFGALSSIGLNLLDVPPFSAVPLPVISMISAVFVCLVALGHWYDVHRWKKEHENSPPDFLFEMDDEE